MRALLKQMFTLYSFVGTGGARIKIVQTQLGFHGRGMLNS